MVHRALTTLLALTFTLNNVQGADNDVERVRNPFVSKHDLGQLMNNQNAGRSFGRSTIPGFQRDSGFASNPSGCLSCTYGGGSRTFGVDHLTAPKASSTRRTYRKEQKFVNGKPVYDFHHERRYQDGQLIHEDRQERGEDDVGVSAQNAGFNEQRGLDRTSLQRNSQSSAFNNYQSSASDLNRYGSDGYIIPQTSSTRREFRKEQKFVNGQPVYEQHHERQFQDGRLVHEEKQERDENDFGVSTGNIGNIDQDRYSSTSRQSSSHLQSDNLGTLGDIGTDVNVDTSRLRQKLQEQMRTFRMKPRLSTVGTSEKSETRSESRFVNGQPVYERNEEQRYKDGNLVHSNVDEKGAADFGTSHLINSAAQGTYSNRGSGSYQGNSENRQQINSAAHGRYATRGSGSYQGNSEGQQQYQQSVSGSQHYPNSGSQQRTYSAVEQSQEQQRNTAYRPSYTPRETSISTQNSNQQSSTSYRPSYTPSRTVYSEETQRQESSTNSGYRPRIISTSNIDESQQVDTSSSVSSSNPGNRPTGSSNSNNRPYNRRTDSSYQTNNEESSQTSQVGQTYGSSSGSSYRPRGSSTTYREESQSQESGTHSASRPSSSNVASSVIVEGENISHDSPSTTPIRIADGDKPAIYEDSYFARTNAESRRGRNRNRSRGVYNGLRQVDLDLGETNGLNEHLITNGLNEHLIGTGLSNTQSSYDGSSQYSSGSSYDRSYGSSSHDSAYNRGSSASENNDNYDISTASSVNDNHIETEYDDHYDETDEDYGSYNEDYDYENTNSENSYYEDENMDRLNKERYDISPYDGIEDIPEVNNEVETSYNPQDSHSQPETTDYHNYDEEENYNRPDQHRPDQHRPDQHRPDQHRPDQHRPDQHRPDQHRPDQHEQVNTGIPSYAYDNQDGNDRTWGGYPQTSEASTPSPYNPEPVPSVDHYQSSYDYSNNEVQQPSYPAVPHGGYESSSTNYQESQEQSSSQYVPASSSSHSSSRTNEERRENIYDNGVYGPGVVITSPHTKTRRTELRTKKKYINGQLIGLTFYERVYENGELVKENITERGRDDLTQEELQQYGISMAEFDLPIYNEDGSYTQRQETTQKKKFVNGQQIYDLHHERKFEDGSLVHENRTEKDEDDFDVSGYNRHGSSGHAVSINTDTHEVAQGHHEVAQGHHTNQQALAGTVAHSTEDRQVTDQHIVNTIPHYTHRREEVRTQQKFVNGVPVYDLQHEKKYVDGQLVHENKTELNEDDFRIQYGHRDALQDILAGQTLSTARDRNYGNYGNYGSTASEQTQSSGASSGHGISGGTQTVALGSGGHQSQSSNSNSASYDSSSTYGSSGYGTGSAGSESSTYGRGSHTAGGAALTSVIGLGTVGTGAQGGQSSYSSSTSESESQSTSVGGALDSIGSSNLGSSNRANGEQQSSYGSSSSYEASQMGTSLLSGHSSGGSGGARVATLDLGSSSLGLGDNLLGSSGHHSQSSTYESGSSQMGTSLLGGHSSAGSGGARVATLDLGASSQGLGSSGHHSQSSSYESGSSQMGTSLLGGHSSAGSGGARVATLDLGASSLGLGSSGQQSQSSSYESRSSQMGTSLLGDHSSAGSGGARVATLDLGASSLGLGDNLLGSSGHQSQSSSYESGSSYGSSSSSSGSSGCVSCVVSTGGGFGASASGLTGAHTYSQGQEMSKEERYENGELVHGQESERDFENGQVVREQSRQYGGRNPLPSSAAARTGLSSSSSSYSSSSQSSSSNTGVCNNNPCGNGGTCIAGLRGALCVCTFGFKGKHCDVAYCPTRFCRYKGVCSVEDGQHMCSCRDGHTGSRCATRSRRHSSKHRRRHASTP